MFASKLYNIFPYTNEIYNKVYGNITGGTWGNDKTMLATMRAIIAPRLKEEERFRGKVLELHGSPTLKDLTDENQFVIINVVRNDENCFDNVDKEINECQDMKELKDIEKYLLEKCNLKCRFYAGTNKNLGIAMVQNLNARFYHIVQSFLPRYFPNLFKDNPITVEEKNVLEGLTKINADQYRNAMKVLGESVNIREAVLNKLVKGFKKQNTDRIIARLQESINNNYDSIRELLEQHRTLLKQINDTNIRINGMKYGNENEEDVLYDYLKCHKNIDILDVSEGTINIRINTKLCHFDAEEWMHERRNGAVINDHSGNNPAFSAFEDRKLFLDAIFNEFPCLTVKMAGAYELSLDGRVYVKNIGENTNGYWPNPHLEKHSCLGGYGPKITESLCNGDIILAIEQCIASAGSVNLGEVMPTFGPMINEWFSGETEKVFVNENGDEMTATEALAWLKETGYKGITTNKLDFNNEEEEEE